MYHSTLPTCRPDYQDVQRTHGDVVEFYDEVGGFMGLAVYMGQGFTALCRCRVAGRNQMTTSEKTRPNRGH
jgi:hypothetical protein